MIQPRGDNDRHESPADEAELSARLQRLGERLGQQRSDRLSENESGQGAISDSSALARGIRLSTEFVAGIVVGAGLGWLIDRLAGTSPLGMIVFLLLGFAAGVLNLIRAAGVVPDNTLNPPGAKS
jgi:ATP synthase protein I